MNNLKQKASYSHYITTIKDKRIAIVIDLDNNPNAPSVTNTVEDILKDLKTEQILYQGSDTVWFYYNGRYVPILEDKEPILNNEKKAIKSVTDILSNEV